MVSSVYFDFALRVFLHMPQLASSGHWMPYTRQATCESNSNAHTRQMNQLVIKV